MLDLPLFDEVAEVVRGMVPAGLGALRVRPRRYGVKVWLDGSAGSAASAPREHYEAQVVGRREVPAASVLALEVGFHLEHPDVVVNEGMLTALVEAEKRWRRDLGSAAEAGVFLGRAEHWRRLSETWLDPDLSDPDMAFEIGTRLVDYITALEPLR